MTTPASNELNPSQNQLILTIDIGGTDIKSAIYDETGALRVRFDNQPTSISEHTNHIAEQVHAICQAAKKDYAIVGVAIATAGVVDTDKGEIVHAGPTIPNYTGTNLKQRVEEVFNLPCSVENDVNAVALGEFWQGAAKDSHSTLCFTLGTGLGGAVIDSQLWHGASFSAGEIGYFPLPDGRRLEEVASTTAMLNNYQQRCGERVDGRAFFARLHEGDEHAETALAEMIEALVQGLLPAIYLLAPEMLVIGGGIACQKEILVPRINHALAAKLPSKRFMPKHICCAELGNAAGMVGALRCWLNAYGENSSISLRQSYSTQDR